MYSLFNKLFVLTLLTGLLTGCFGVSQPTDSQVKEMSEEYFNQQFKGLFLASEVVKKNGYKKNDTHYVAEVSVMATAQLSLEDYAKATMTDPALSSMDKIASTMAMGMLKMTLPDFKEGDQIEFEREYLFIRTDNGWQLKQELKASQETL